MIRIVMSVELQAVKDSGQHDASKIRRYDMIAGKMTNDRPSQQARFQACVAVVPCDAAKYKKKIKN